MVEGRRPVHFYVQIYKGVAFRTVDWTNFVYTLSYSSCIFPNFAVDGSIFGFQDMS